MAAQETSLADLQTGRDNLQAGLQERTGQLKALVKENFDHFISCKTTIDDIHKRLRDAESGHAGGNSSYVSTNDVIDTVSEVRDALLIASTGLFSRIGKVGLVCLGFGFRGCRIQRSVLLRYRPSLARAVLLPSLLLQQVLSQSCCNVLCSLVLCCENLMEMLQPSGTRWPLAC